MIIYLFLVFVSETRDVNTTLCTFVIAFPILAFDGKYRLF